MRVASYSNANPQPGHVEVAMGRSSLERTGESPPVTKKGHTTAALGPSDLSDTGSDIVGAPGLDEDDAVSGGVHQIHHVARGARHAARVAAGRHAPDEDAGIQGMFLHPDPVPQDCAA